MRNQLVEAQQDERTQNRERRATGHTVTFKSRAQWFKWQQGLLPTQPELASVHSLVLQEVILRIEKATKRWLSVGQQGTAAERLRVKPPRRIPRKDYRSLTYP